MVNHAAAMSMLSFLLLSTYTGLVSHSHLWTAALLRVRSPQPPGVGGLDIVPVSRLADDGKRLDSLSRAGRCVSIKKLR